MPAAADLVLDAIAELVAEGYRSASPLLRLALAAVQVDPEIRRVPRHLARACWIAFALSDDDALGALAAECATNSRERGAIRVLPEVLDYQGLRELRAGSLNVAEDFFSEQIELHGVLRRHSGPGEAARLIVSAWRGRETDVRAEAAELAAEAGRFGLVVEWSEYAMMVLELGLGNYQAASSLAWNVRNEDVLLGDLRAADAVEAHVRSGNEAAAPTALAYLAATGGGQSELARPRSPRSQPRAGGARLRRRGALLRVDRQSGHQRGSAAPRAHQAGLRRVAPAPEAATRRPPRARGGARHLRVDGRRRLCGPCPHRAARDRCARPQAPRRDASRPHAAGMADRPPRRRRCDQL